MKGQPLPGGRVYVRKCIFYGPKIMFLGHPYAGLGVRARLSGIIVSVLLFQEESPLGDRRFWKVTQKMVLMSFKNLFQVYQTFLELFSHCAYNNRRQQLQKAVHFDIPCNGKSQASLSVGW
jgi:hypothetical protein